jgi:hypothetical protein
MPRREVDYASLGRGGAVIGLGPIAKLPADGPGPGFNRTRLAADRGAGVELVLEVEDLDTALQAVVSAGDQVVEPPRDQPWVCAISVSQTPTATTGGSRTPEQLHGQVLNADMRWRRRCG